jgi:hypothetical protein
MDRSVVVPALFVLGILIAVVAAFVPSAILPWVVGGAGLLTGVVAWKQAKRGIVIAAIVLVVSLSAILQQPFNPKWLNDVLFFIRVYVAHVGLAGGLLTVFAPPSQVWL